MPGFCLPKKVSQGPGQGPAGVWPSSAFPQAPVLGPLEQLCAAPRSALGAVVHLHGQHAASPRWPCGDRVRVHHLISPVEVTSEQMSDRSAGTLLSSLSSRGDCSPASTLSGHDPAHLTRSFMELKRGWPRGAPGFGWGTPRPKTFVI